MPSSSAVKSPGLDFSMLSSVATERETIDFRKFLGPAKPKASTDEEALQEATSKIGTRMDVRGDSTFIFSRFDNGKKDSSTIN
mmetsp:Transcript_107049/g.299653  ORF Transcript_107049/g.299653 Transcript_107049/m.299653 type:complete len:83 (-) Transcript_107049:259-507(-)